MRVRITQLDGKLPNLALMKLSSWHKERGDEVTTEQLGRFLLPKVGYMELDNDVKGYACGNCGYMAEGAMCRNPAVLAPVSANRGCCNLFWNEEQVVFPPHAKE
jgi:hypothetical protein